MNSPGGPQPGTGPQPGSEPQPGYGQLPEYGPGYGQPRDGQPGYAQPGYAQQPGHGPGSAQPWHGQPGYGQPPGDQPGYGQPYPGYGPPFSRYGGQAGADPTLAPWWRRLLAWLIDSAILTAVSAPVWIRPFVDLARKLRTIGLFYPSLSSPGAAPAVHRAEAEFGGSLLVALLVVVLIMLAYYWIQYAAWGRTIGKRALGTTVVIATTRQRIGAGQAGLRSAVFVLVPCVLSLFFIIDSLWLLWDPRRQCLHDKAAGTVVVLS